MTAPGSQITNNDCDCDVDWLEELQRDILAEYPLGENSKTGAWVFPHRVKEGVKGFHGSGRLFFLGERPSELGNPEKPRVELYEEFKSRDFGDSHITDFFKNAMLVKDSKRKELEVKEAKVCTEFLLREIEKLRPVMIIAMGGEAERLYRVHVMQKVRERIGVAIPVHRIYHYAARNYGLKRWETFKRHLDDVRSFAVLASALRDTGSGVRG